MYVHWRSGQRASSIGPAFVRANERAQVEGYAFLNCPFDVGIDDDCSGIHSIYRPSTPKHPNTQRLTFVRALLDDDERLTTTTATTTTSTRSTNHLLGRSDRDLESTALTMRCARFQRPSVGRAYSVARSARGISHLFISRGDGGNRASVLG